MQDPSSGTFPFVHAESDHDDDSQDQGDECAGIRPGIETASEVEAGQEEGKADCQQRDTREVKMCQFLPEGKMVETGVSLGRSIADEDTDCGEAPEAHLNPPELAPSVLDVVPR